jgi:hypothetical protein
MNITHFVATGLLAFGVLATLPPAYTVDSSANVCNAQWCKDGAGVKAAQAIIDAQVKGYDCAPVAKGQIPSSLLVKGYAVNRSVVSSMSLDAAYALNGDTDKRNDVVVIKSCK